LFGVPYVAYQELSRSSPIVVSDGTTYQGSYVGSTAAQNTYPPIAGHFREYPPGALSGANVAGFDTLKADWDAAKGIPPAATRTVFTAVQKNGSYVQTAFNANNVSVLAPPMGLTTTQATVAINGILAGGLGGIDHSTAAVVGPSSAAGSATRPTVAYVGALDGMLHAIAISGSGVTAGSELWAFIPPSQLPKIAGYQAGVDGSPQVADAFIDNGTGLRSWRTLLAIPDGAFGGTLDVLDVTDPLNPVYLWTASTPAGSYAMGAASGAAFGTIAGALGRQDALFVTTNNAGTAGNGFNLYALDAATGSVIWQWNHLYGRTIPNSTTPVPNDVPGVPALVDTSGDGGLEDKLFFGDLDGRIWAIDATGKAGPPQTPLFDAGVNGQPIAASVSIYRDATTMDVVVLAATGGADWVPSSTASLVVAVDAQKGATLFQDSLAAGERVYAAATIAGNDAYLVTSFGNMGGGIAASSGDAGNVRRIDLGSHAIDMTTAVQKGGSEVAVGADGTVVAASAAGETALSPAGGNAGRNASGVTLDDAPKPVLAEAWLDLH